MTTIKQLNLTPDLKKRVLEGFAQHSISSIGFNGLSQEPIAFEIQIGDDFVGCIVVQIFWGQLHIKYLFVEEPYRGKGYAKEFMKYALNFGKSQGCSFAFVETMSFQAPEFYQKLGFKVEMVRHGYERDTSLYYLKRDL
jgi:ribosomal protein S18 acetylase RimI-like enzyme